GARTELEAGDILLVDLTAPDSELGELVHRLRLQALPLAAAELSDRSQEIGMVEAMVPAESELVGKTLVDARLRSRYSLTAIGLRHGAAAVANDIARKPLKTGDTLLLLGPWEAIDELRLRSPNLVVLDPPAAEQGVSAPSRALGAVLSVALMIALMISGVVPNVQAALIAC